MIGICCLSNVPCIFLFSDLCVHLILYAIFLYSFTGGSSGPIKKARRAGEAARLQEEEKKRKAAAKKRKGKDVRRDFPGMWLHHSFPFLAFRCQRGRSSSI